MTRHGKGLKTWDLGIDSPFEPNKNRKKRILLPLSTWSAIEVHTARRIDFSTETWQELRGDAFMYI